MWWQLRSTGRLIVRSAATASMAAMTRSPTMPSLTPDRIAEIKALAEKGRAATLVEHIAMNEARRAAILALLADREEMEREIKRLRTERDKLDAERGDWVPGAKCERCAGTGEARIGDY